MPHNITGSNAFTDPVSTYSDGDPVSQASEDPAVQALANRDVYLKARADTADANITSAASNISALQAIIQSRGQFLAINGSSGPSAGNLGEQTRITRLSSSSLSLTDSTPANLCATPNVSLGAGDWEMSICVRFRIASGADAEYVAAVSLTSATLPASSTFAVPSNNGEFMMQGPLPLLPTGTVTVSSVPIRVNLNTTTSFYLVVELIGNGGDAFGVLTAKRVR